MVVGRHHHECNIAKDKDKDKYLRSCISLEDLESHKMYELSRFIRLK